MENRAPDQNPVSAASSAEQGKQGSAARRNPAVQQNNIPKVLVMCGGNCGVSVARRVMRTFGATTDQLGIGITNTQRAQLDGFKPGGHSTHVSPKPAAQSYDEHASHKYAVEAKAEENFASWLADRNERFHLVEFDEQFGAGADPERAKQLVRKKLKAFAKIFAKYDAIILVGGLGKGTGSGILPELAKLANKMKKVCVATPVFPYAFEGPGHLRRAQAARHELYMTTTTFIGYNENVYRVVTPVEAAKLSVHDLNQIVNEKLIIPTILLILELLQRGGKRIGDIENDLRDFAGRICSYGTVGFIGFHEVRKSGGEAIDAAEVVREITSNPLMGGSNIVKKGTAAMPHFHGSVWNSYLYREISMGVKGVIGDNLEEFLPGILQNPEEDRQYVALVVVAPYEEKVRADLEASLPKAERASITSETKGKIAAAVTNAVNKSDLDPDVPAAPPAHAEPAIVAVTRDLVAESERVLQEARSIYKGVLPDVLDFEDWKPEYHLELHSHNGTIPVPLRVDARFRNLWQDTLRNPNSTHADFERLINILVVKKAWTRSDPPDNPRKRTAVLA
jgi:hypothetical protein